MSEFSLLGDNILVISAHPDDAEIAMGGTIAKLANLGKRVVVAIYSVPSNFNNRIKEAEEGAKIINVEFKIMSYKERQVGDMKMTSIVREIDSLIEEINPSCVFTHFLGDTHQDHRLLAEGVFSSSRNKPFNIINFEQSSAFSVSLKEFNPNFYIDITDFSETKYKAIMSHQSQKNVINSIDHYKKRDLYYGSICRVERAEAFIVSRLIK